MSYKFKTPDVRTSKKGKTLQQKARKLTLLIIAILAISITGCRKNDAPGHDETSASSKNKAKVSGAQPLPQGKRNFSVTMGNFDLNGYTWVRVINWTFNETNGTVGGTSWTWRSDVKAGKAIFNDHFCTMGGASSNCNVYAPTGWSTQSASIWQSWSGTYTYNHTTGRLDIQWNTWAGNPTTASDSWTVTLPETGLARVNLITSNYTLTHGRGYGSNAAWTTYKTIGNMFSSGLPSYTSLTGRNVRAAGSSTAGTVTIYPTQSTPGLWGGAAFSLAGCTTPSSSNPAGTTMHKYDSEASGCNVPEACTTTRTGSTVHLATTSNRQVAYNNWCACLPKAADWPCYTGNMHPMALMQVIDDGGTLKGFVGIEAQNPPEAGYNGKFQLQCVDYSSIP